MSLEKDGVQVYLRLKGEIANRFERIKEAMGLKADTEVIRALITSYWNIHQDDLIPQLTYINADANGVKIFDRAIGRIVDVAFRPEGVKCTYCEAGRCRHTKFCLARPKVKRILEKKHKEGWKVPEEV